MYKIAICDDEDVYLELVYKKMKKYCEKKEIHVTIKQYKKCGNLVEDAECGRLYDAYILDIKMEGYSGMEAARAIRKNSSTAVIIFLTAYAEYSVDACEMNIFRYVLKEKLDVRFDEVMDQLFYRLDRLEMNGMYLISNQRKYVKVLQKDIIYIYKRQKNIVFVLLGGKEEWERGTLRDAFEKLNSRDMFFLDRGIILNLFHVQKIEGYKIIMTEAYDISTTIEHVTELKRVLATYWGELV